MSEELNLREQAEKDMAAMKRLVYSKDDTENFKTVKRDCYGEEFDVIYRKGTPGMTVIEIKERIEKGDEWAKLVYENFAYQLAKYIGSYACVLGGEIDAIVMTGGVSNDETFIANVKKYAGWIAPFIVYGGDFEMEALASGAIRALDKVEETKVYTGEPVWSGFDFEYKE